MDRLHQILSSPGTLKAAETAGDALVEEAQYLATVKYLVESNASLHTAERLEFTVWPSTSNFTFFQLPLARDLARAATTSGAHTGKEYGNLLEKSAFVWGEFVRGEHWQDLRILDIRHFLSTSGIWTVPLAAASLQARLNEWEMMVVTPSSSSQIQQFVQYFDLTHGLVPTADSSISGWRTRCCSDTNCRII